MSIPEETAFAKEGWIAWFGGFGAVLDLQCTSEFVKTPSFMIVDASKKVGEAISRDVGVQDGFDDGAKLLP